MCVILANRPVPLTQVHYEGGRMVIFSLENSCFRSLLRYHFCTCTAPLLRRLFLYTYICVLFDLVIVGNDTSAWSVQPNI